MTKDEIIEMAREAGFDQNAFSEIIVRHSNGSWVDVREELQHFADLVAAKEREACAKSCDWMKDLAEKLMEDPDYYMGQYERMGAFEDAAEAIRARGGK